MTASPPDPMPMSTNPTPATPPAVAALPAAVEVDAADEGEEGRIGYGRFGRWTPLALAVLLVLSLFAIGVAGQRESASDADSSSGNAPTGGGNGAQIGAPAPDFDLALLDGSTLDLHDLHGKTVVLNFWASWCAPCKEEMPALQRLAATSGDDVAIVGVGLRNDEDADARAFITQTGITFPTGRDTGTPASGPRGPIELTYGVLAAPTTIVIAPDGTIANIAMGPQTEEQLYRLIEG